MCACTKANTASVVWPMKKTIAPVLVEIRARVFSERLVLSRVLDRAGVSGSTWWRWVNGGDFKHSTVARIGAAIDEMVADRAADPQTEN